MYQIVHEGRARLFGLGIFGGSNGFWDAATLKVSRRPDRELPVVSARLAAPAGPACRAAARAELEVGLGLGCPAPLRHRKASMIEAGGLL